MVLIGIVAFLLLLIPLTLHGLNRVDSQTPDPTEKPLSVAIYTPANDWVKQPTTTERLKLALNYFCRKYGTDCATIDRIIFCESSWNANAKNKDSSASGLGQFLTSTFNHYCAGDKSNPYHQLECMNQMIANNGIGHWNESRHCWN